MINSAELRTKVHFIELDDLIDALSEAINVYDETGETKQLFLYSFLTTMKLSDKDMNEFEIKEDSKVLDGIVNLYHASPQ